MVPWTAAVADPPDPDWAAGSHTWVTPERAGTDRPFLLYFGDGPAYLMVTGYKATEEGLPFFHTSDRALVEHLAFRLQRDLGIALGV